MATFKLKGVKDLESRLKRNLLIEINKLFRDKALRDQIGQLVIDDIKKNYESSKPPSEGTLRWREVYDKLNKTDPAYKPTKIKAVFTGELLEDLRKNIKADTTTKSFVIEHSDKKHSKYQGVTKKIGSRSPYSEISKGLIEDYGHNYMTLSPDAQTKITEIVRDKIFEIISRIK